MLPNEQEQGKKKKSSIPKSSGNVGSSDKTGHRKWLSVKDNNLVRKKNKCITKQLNQSICVT